MRATVGLLTALVLLVMAAGCGSGKLRTRGRVLNNGAPLVPAEGDIVRVTFVPLPEGGGRAMDFYTARFNPADGTFEAAGKDGQGVPPGKYRIAVEHLRKRRDLLKGAFDAERSPFVREISSSSEELTLDLAKPK
jgi:hypothetical protein